MLKNTYFEITVQRYNNFWGFQRKNCTILKKPLLAQHRIERGDFVLFQHHDFGHRTELEGLVVEHLRRHKLAVFRLKHDELHVAIGLDVQLFRQVEVTMFHGCRQGGEIGGDEIVFLLAHGRLRGLIDATAEEAFARQFGEFVLC